MRNIITIKALIRGMKRLKIKSTKPEDVKKKADLNAEAKDNFNKAIPYGDKALSTLGSIG